MPAFEEEINMTDDTARDTLLGELVDAKDLDAMLLVEAKFQAVERNK